MVWGMLFCSWRLVNEAALLTLIPKKPPKNSQLVLCKTSLLKLPFMHRIMPTRVRRRWYFRALCIFWIASEHSH